MLRTYLNIEENDPFASQYCEAGVDEVARGPLFGPVFAAAVILKKDVELHKWLNDSKKVTKKRRAEVRNWIYENSESYAVANVNNKIIDTINIRNASLLAMETAIRNLSTTPNLLVVDGNYFHGVSNFGNYDNQCCDGNVPPTVEVEVRHVTVIAGDAKYAHVAAASILAKELHDDYIKELVEENPELHIKYDLLNNMGYGTPKHIEGIKTYGPTEYHRMSFLGKILGTIGATTSATSTWKPRLPDIQPDNDDDDDDEIQKERL